MILATFSQSHQHLFPISFGPTRYLWWDRISRIPEIQRSVKGVEKEVLSLLLLCVVRQKLLCPEFSNCYATQTLLLITFFFFWVCVFTSGPGSFAWVSLDWLWKPKLRKISDIIFQSLPQTRACFLTSQKVERSSLAISWILFCYSGRTRLAAFSKISTYPERETSGLDFPRASKGQTENQGI